MWLFLMEWTMNLCQKKIMKFLKDLCQVWIERDDANWKIILYVWLVGFKNGMDFIENTLNIKYSDNIWLNNYMTKESCVWWCMPIILAWVILQDSVSKTGPGFCSSVIRPWSQSPVLPNKQNKTKLSEQFMPKGIENMSTSKINTHVKAVLFVIIEKQKQ